MFTGIVSDVGQIKAVQSQDQNLELTLETTYPDLTLGESVAVNGVCLTVSELPDPKQARFFVSRETLEKSNLGSLSPQTQVNLERAMKLSDRLSGHLVQGHTDGLGTVISIEPEAESHRLTVSIHSKLSRYVVAKGSITLDGVSLTINGVHDRPDCSLVEINLIPHTFEHTRFRQLKPGDHVNVEVDVLAKYAERMIGDRQWQQ